MSVRFIQRTHVQNHAYAFESRRTYVHHVRQFSYPVCLGF